MSFVLFCVYRIVEVRSVKMCLVLEMSRSGTLGAWRCPLQVIKPGLSVFFFFFFHSHGFTLVGLTPPNPKALHTTTNSNFVSRIFSRPARLSKMFPWLSRKRWVRTSGEHQTLFSTEQANLHAGKLFQIFSNLVILESVHISLLMF